MDLYSVLGVEKGASQDEIKRSYRRLARQYHPDVNPDDNDAEERFKAISAAGDILTDPEKRKLYDEFGEEATRPGFDAEQARAYAQARANAYAYGASDRGGWEDGSFYPGDIFGGSSRFRGGINLEDLFGGFADVGGAGPRTGNQPARGADLNAEIQLPLRDAILGTTRELSLDKPSACPDCEDPGPHGTAACNTCHGRGSVLRTAKLKVKVPAGIDAGQTIRLPGQGHPGRRGGPDGDLLLDVRVRSHPRLRRDGKDLYMTVPVTVPEAMVGAEIRIPTLSGFVNLTIPPASQNGASLRLRGKGVPSQGGDLYVGLEVVLPPGEGPQHQRAAQAMSALYDADIRHDLRL